MIGGVGICVWPKKCKFLRVLNGLDSFHLHRFPHSQIQNLHRATVDVGEATLMRAVIEEMKAFYLSLSLPTTFHWDFVLEHPTMNGWDWDVGSGLWTNLKVGLMSFRWQRYC